MKPELGDLAREHTEAILAFFGVNAAVVVQQDDQTIDLAVETEATGRLIGHRGEALAALQQLVNAMVRGATDDRRYVTVDIGNYKKSRAEHLSEKVREDAKKVLETGEARHLRPMNAAERRIVHMALADMPEIETESEGEGHERRVVISKKD